MANYCRVLWRELLHVTCGLTVCTPGSAPGPTLGNEYGKTLPIFTSIPGYTVQLDIPVGVIDGESEVVHYVSDDDSGRSRDTGQAVYKHATRRLAYRV